MAGELRSTGSKVNYNTAKAECEAQGAQLPVLTSQAEHDALLAFARDNTGPSILGILATMERLQRHLWNGGKNSSALVLDRSRN
nr:hypothetical protein BaRGS_001613 [Batillaria attramentaria]